MQEWEPFWFFELRSTVSRALIGRKRMVAIGCGLLAMGTFMLLLALSPFGIVGSYTYASAVLGVDVYGAKSRPSTHMDSPIAGGWSPLDSNEVVQMPAREKKGTKAKPTQKKETSASGSAGGQGKHAIDWKKEVREVARKKQEEDSKNKSKQKKSWQDELKELDEAMQQSLANPTPEMGKQDED
eukprot:8523749-Pyramimonas_sp.AAC.1